MDVESLISVWKGYARANQVRANVDRARGDLFGAELNLARGAVRLAAAELLGRFRDDPKTAAETMHRTARGLAQRRWPFAEFDQVAVKYTQSRMWQDCARSIDPSLPEVQPRLEG